jgi:hypothetical protein
MTQQETYHLLQVIAYIVCSIIWVYYAAKGEWSKATFFLVLALFQVMNPI